MKSRAIVLCLVLGAASALSACSSDDSSSVSDAKATFCQSLVDVKQSEAAIADLNADSTVDDAKSAVADLGSAVTAAKSAADAVGQAEADTLQSAYNDLKSSLDSISGSDTLADAAPDVVKAAATFQAQLQALRSKNCGGAVASSVAVPTT